MTMCYVHNYCGICRKEGCDKRLKDYGGENAFCKGECHTCPSAIHHHSMIDEEPFFSMKGLSLCTMYHLQEHHSVEFYGRVGENSGQSEIEQAISQVYRCKGCSFGGIIELMQELPDCRKYFMKKEGIQLEDLIGKQKSLKLCTSLTEVQNGIISIISGNPNIKLEEICALLKDVVADVFFIHELTIIPILSEFVSEEKIIKNDDDEYYIK